MKPVRWVGILVLGVALGTVAWAALAPIKAGSR